MDALVFPIWFGCSFLLGFSAWKVARTWFPDELPIPMLMHTLVLSWAAIVVVTFVLGIAGILTGVFLMLGVALLAMTALIGLRLLHKPRPLPISFISRSEILWLWFWFALLTFWIGHSITRGLLRFPTDWDTLDYHLPMIVQWLHAGSLYAPDCSRWSTPGNNEILGLWLVAPYSGDFMIGLNNLPSAVLLAFATVEMSKNLGLSSTLANMTGFAVVANSVVLTQIVDASNDVAVAALFVACLAYGFRLAKNGRDRVSADLMLFAAALGLLAGVKFYALGYAAVAGTTFFLLTWKRQGWRHGMAVAVMGLVGLFVWSGYWYVRNTWITGSPLYPKDIFSQTDEMANIYPDLAQTTFLGNGRPELYELSVKAIWRMAGPLHVAAFVLLPFTLAWILITARRETRKNETEAANFRWAFAFLVAASCSILLITPFAVEDSPGTLNQMHWGYCPVRYGMCFMSLMVVALALVLQDIFSRNSILTMVPRLFFLASGVYQLALPNRSLPLETIELAMIIAGNMLLLVGNWYLVANLWPRPGMAFLLVAFLALVGGGAWGIDHVAEKWHRGFAPHYDTTFSPEVFSYFADKDPGEVHICVLEARCYPFFGSRRQVHVCQPVVIQSPAWLRGYLLEKKVGFVAGESPEPLRSRRLIWGLARLLEETPQEFQAINPGHRLVVFQKK